MIKCPNCQGELTFDPAYQLVKCPYCQTEFNPHTLEISVKYAKEEVKEQATDSESEKIQAKSFKCSQCGAELLTFDETAITFCSYCGSQAILESRMIEINKPEYVIPFKITKEQAIEAYKKRINGSLFAPKYMKDNIVIDKFRGIYMPYCIYNAEYHGEAVNKGSKYKNHSGDYDYYDDFEIITQIDAKYEGISYDLVSKLYDTYTLTIPYNFKAAEVFNLNYLIGYYADVMDVQNDVYDTNAQIIMSHFATKEMLKDKTYKKHGCYDPTIIPEITKRKIGMFPLYFLAIKNKKNDKIHYAMVNGATGKVATDIPIQFYKYVLASFIISIPVFIIVNTFVFMLPMAIVILSLILAIISMVISNNRINSITKKEQYIDDLGHNPLKSHDVSYVNIEKVKKLRLSSSILAALIIIGGFPLIFISIIKIISTLNPSSYGLSIIVIIISLNCMSLLMMLADSINKRDFSAKNKNININRIYIKMPLLKKIRKYLYKQLIGIVIAIIIVITKPVSDVYYYVGAIINLLLIIASFYDLIKEQNLLASNKLPQLEIRGGEENE